MSAAQRKQLFGLMAEFDTPAGITHAAKRVCEAGYKWFDCHVPFPVHGLDKAMGVKPTWLPIIVFFLGLTGACAGVALQTFTNSFSFKIWALVFVQGYDYYISGKPSISGEAFVPITFELTVLFSAVGCFLILLAMNRLPMWYHPTLKSPRFARATDDRFFVVIEAKDPQFSRERTEALLRSLNPLSIEALEA
jgi:hypothetical protein